MPCYITRISHIPYISYIIKFPIDKLKTTHYNDVCKVHPKFKAFFKYKNILYLNLSILYLSILESVDC